MACVPRRHCAWVEGRDAGFWRVWSRGGGLVLVIRVLELGCPLPDFFPVIFERVAACSIADRLETAF